MEYLLVIILIIIFIIFLFWKDSKPSPNNPIVYGTFKKISGDPAQSPFFKNMKYEDGYKIIYFNESQEITNIGHKKNNNTVHQNNSQSSIINSLNKEDLYFDETSGYGKFKHGRENVHYTALHTYLRVNGKVYYKNTYFFSNDEISSAIYVKE